jgi:hypothetical protein
VKSGGGIYLNGDRYHSHIVNNLIRQNCIGEEQTGAGIHSACASVYIKNNTVADNYHRNDCRPTYGKCPDGSEPPTSVYGIWGCNAGYWTKMIHNIIYYNGPSTFDDMNIVPNQMLCMYSDVQMHTMSLYPDYVSDPANGTSGNTNYDFVPGFEGKKDEDRPCNSTFYFLNIESPCINKGVEGSYDDEDQWHDGMDAWGQFHCDLVNTHYSSGCLKDVLYSVHRNGSPDLDYYCDDDGCRPPARELRIDLGYHYDVHGMNYVELSSFTVDASGDKAVVTWETATEMDNAGFLVYRCDGEASDCSKISDLIAASGDAALGATYSFTDTNVVPGASYYYYLVDIDLSGEWTAHGPVFTRIPLDLDAIGRLPELESVIR